MVLSRRVVSLSVSSHEWKLSLFGLEDGNGRVIDVQRTFAPKPTVATVAFRFVALAWVVASLVHNAAILERPWGFWFAYYTNLSVLPSLFYFVVSFLASIQFARSQQQQQESQKKTLLVRLMWILFPSAAATQFAATVLFWLLVFDYNDTPSYLNLMKHGILFAVIMLDGLVVSRIPVRIRSIAPLLVYNLGYCVFSIVHSVARMGNPWSHDNDPTTDDDAIYGALNWNKRFGTALFWTVFANLVLFPALFFVVFALSSVGGRRYTNDYPPTKGVDELSNQDTNPDEELGQYPSV